MSRSFKLSLCLQMYVDQISFPWWSVHSGSSAGCPFLIRSPEMEPNLHCFFSAGCSGEWHHLANQAPYGSKVTCVVTSHPLESKKNVLANDSQELKHCHLVLPKKQFLIHFLTVVLTYTSLWQIHMKKSTKHTWLTYKPHTEGSQIQDWCESVNHCTTMPSIS